MSAANPVVDSKSLKFIKDKNGNVLLMKLDNTLIASFNPAQNLLRVSETPNKFKIQSNAAFGENSLILDYSQVKCNQCVPMIEAVNFNDFLVELSNKFFFWKGTGDSGSDIPSNAKCSSYGLVRPTFVYTKSLITKNSKFIRLKNVDSERWGLKIQYGGYLEGSLEPYFKPYFGGNDLMPDTEIGLQVESLISLDDLFIRLYINARRIDFDVYFIVNPDSNTFTLLNADPMYFVSTADYQYDAISDTLTIQSLKRTGDPLSFYVRWKNVPELEAMPV
ncbi:hypothetical protein [Flavobacterium hydatis]|uniref:Uncharacterized protein n=1 Tax=Flavobacterium hydatis TaxID=991 RepID=A0A086AL12_FLAHY|nr:hypothetical protein [Flavobacterium hydatis]KFF17376.1 hypothetical protein IW20_08545 [Flavobacterium hydatis]OXA97325.1 hypothetical protein B0A62_03495 [Flavobacterium hydatis]